ncbi:iron ABC transporter permease [uncultured Cardiobacterium sp.]|uniref:ABC transporter permease n=1 Tax=uncultured Cardiobacterium sp. TaxID=417619 RepID=UPI003452EF5D
MTSLQIFSRNIFMKVFLRWTNQSAFWVAVALLCYALLPAFALDYGIVESTWDERLAAMGWHSLNLSALWFAPVLIFLLFPLFNSTPAARAKGELVWIAIIAFITLVSAKLAHVSLGYAVIGLAGALVAIATLALARLKVLQGDKFIIASLLIIILLIALFIVFPTGAIFVAMFYEDGAFHPQQVLRILSQSYILRVIGNSLMLSGFVGLMSTIFGLAFALYTTRIARRTAFIGKIFSILPIVTPPFVVGLGVTLMLGRSGYLTEWLGFANSNWLYGFNGIAIAQILAFTPLAFMILDGALKSIHPSIEEASYTLRANRYQTFFQIIFPLLRPALANAFLLVFVQSLADFSNPLVLGGSFDVIATQIYFYIAGSQLDYASASTLGTLLLLFSLGIFIVQYLWIGNRSYITVSGKSYRGEVQELPRGLKNLISGLLAFWVLFNLLLYGSIFYGSFTVNWGVDYNLTLRNYQILFGQGFSDGAWPSLINTLIYAGIAAVFTAALGLLIAYIVVRKEFRGKKTLEFLTMLCFAIPGTAAGVSYILAFNDAPLYITGTGIIVIISMVMRDLPVGMRAAIAGLGQLDKSLDEASLSLKGSSLKTIRYIILPLLKPALLSALVTSFVKAMTTVSAIIFLVTADTRVATAYILNRVEDGEYGTAIAYGSILIVVMMSIILFFDWIIGDTRIARSKARQH